MFGEFGISLKNLMFGLIADNVLYLKTDDENRQRFEDDSKMEGYCLLLTTKTVKVYKK